MVEATQNSKTMQLITERLGLARVHWNRFILCAFVGRPPTLLISQRVDGKRAFSLHWYQLTHDACEDSQLIHDINILLGLQNDLVLSYVFVAEINSIPTLMMGRYVKEVE